MNKTTHNLSDQVFYCGNPSYPSIATTLKEKVLERPLQEASQAVWVCVK
jgi:hypothetical protein